MFLKYEITEIDDGNTVKNILQNQMKLSRRLITRLKASGSIFLDDKSVFVNVKVRCGSILRLEISDDTHSENIESEEMELTIIYEDDYLIAINKPSNLVVHPTCLHPFGTLANGLQYHFIQQNIKTKIRPVSRLDRNTSGVVVFAKSDFAQDFLIRQMRNNSFEKIYLGVTYGNWENNKGIIDLPISRKPGSIMIRHIANDGDRAITHYRVIKFMNGFSLVEFRLETGRTHQIRVHCQAVGHALVGDELYAPLYECDEVNYDTLIKRQALHSYRSSFPHPLTGEILYLEAPLASDIVNLLTNLHLKP
jgi:23S rRNA pseudouridine1911/1915/1917 synthase